LSKNIVPEVSNSKTTDSIETGDKSYVKIIESKLKTVNTNYGDFKREIANK